ncbi:MAG: hypothetical protein ACYSUC_09585 [Planctomycetota bacterium]|jgi:hypothetical protein
MRLIVDYEVIENAGFIEAETRKMSVSASKNGSYDDTADAQDVVPGRAMCILSRRVPNWR